MTGFFTRITLIAIAVLLSSCGASRLPSFAPHKMDVRQGNMVTSEMRRKLKLGMTRVQVRAVLGAPLINDALHANRWDYVYRLEQDSKLVEQQRMTVYFDDDALARIDDGTMPPQPVAASAIEAAPPVIMPVVTEAAPVEQVVLAADAAPAADAASVIPLAAEQAAVDAVQVWAAAWSARDVEKYLAVYAPEFKPASGMSRTAWEAQRRDRIAKAKTIKVELSDIKVNIQDENRASVTFKQSYRANNHEDVTHKTLELEKVGDAWLIVSEQAAEK